MESLLVSRAVVAGAGAFRLRKVTFDRERRASSGAELLPVVPGASFRVGAQLLLAFGGRKLAGPECLQVPELDESVRHQTVAAIQKAEYARIARVTLIERLQLDQLSRKGRVGQPHVLGRR